MNILNIGIIGSGFGTNILLPILLNNKNVCVKSICSDSYIDNSMIINYGRDWEKLINESNIEALIIAVSPKSQYNIIKKAISSGIHIFAEKPLTSNLEEAKEIINLLSIYNITHCIDFIFPEIEEWKFVKNIVDKKIFGKLRHISVKWNWLSESEKNCSTNWKNDIENGGGALSYYFSHGLNYIEFFAGKIIDTHFFSIPSTMNVSGEAGFDMILKLENNIQANIQVSSFTKGLISHEISFIFEDNFLLLSNTNSITSNFRIECNSINNDYFNLINKFKPNLNHRDRVDEIDKLLARFVESCLNKVQMEPSFYTGYRVQELIHKIRYT